MFWVSNRNNADVIEVKKRVKLNHLAGGNKVVHLSATYLTLWDYARLRATS